MSSLTNSKGGSTKLARPIFETFVVYADLMPTVDETARLGIQPTAWNTPTSEDTQTQHQ
jgi:hypothetical protein